MATLTQNYAWVECFFSLNDECYLSFDAAQVKLFCSRMVGRIMKLDETHIYIMCIYIYPRGGRFTGNSCPVGVYIYISIYIYEVTCALWCVYITFNWNHWCRGGFQESGFHHFVGNFKLNHHEHVSFKGDCCHVSSSFFTWKSAAGKGDSFWKLSFFSFQIKLGECKNRCLRICNGFCLISRCWSFKKPCRWFGTLIR